MKRTIIYVGMAASFVVWAVCATLLCTGPYKRPMYLHGIPYDSHAVTIHRVSEQPDGTKTVWYTQDGKDTTLRVTQKQYDSLTSIP